MVKMILIVSMLALPTDITPFGGWIIITPEPRKSFRERTFPHEETPYNPITNPKPTQTPWRKPPLQVM